MDGMFEIPGYVRNPLSKRKFLLLYILLSCDYDFHVRYLYYDNENLSAGSIDTLTTNIFWDK